jgi:sporulation protein YlmC with PRC-barrel domain
MEVLVNKLKNVEDLPRINFYKGNKVFSKSGEYVGKVVNLVFKEHTVKGIVVRGKALVVLGMDFIDSNSGNVIMLKIDPVTNLIGKFVFDSNGRKLGRVVGLERNTSGNNYSELVIRKKFYRPTFTVKKTNVAVSRENIILKNEI